jgi:hypothetical protein
MSSKFVMPKGACCFPNRGETFMAILSFSLPSIYSWLKGLESFLEGMDAGFYCYYCVLLALIIVRAFFLMYSSKCVFMKP